MSARAAMLGAAADGVGEPWEPKSSSQAPGKRGERPPSYNTGNRYMKKKIADTQSGISMPKEVWFLSGALLMVLLYMYHAFFGSRE